MRLLALLLLAAAAGFTVGRLTAPEVGGAGGRRSPPAPSEAEEPAAPEPPPDPPNSRAPEVRAATEGVVAPSEQLPVDEDDEGKSAETGVIEVQFDATTGYTRAWTAWRTMTGAYMEYPLDADEGESAVRFDLPPGMYDVWWLDAQGRRRGTRAAIEGGKLTVLRAAEYTAAPPVPTGFGILEVEVDATWGSGLACQLSVGGKGDETEHISTNAHGRGSMTLAPGRCTVRIGDREHVLTVAEGQVSNLHIAHREEGDLVLDGAQLAGHIGIKTAGGALERRELWTGTLGGELRQGLVYLVEGEYDLFAVRNPQDRLGVPLGRAVVHAGRTTVFRYELPRGGLDLRVHARRSSTTGGAATVQVLRVVDGRETSEAMILQGGFMAREARFKVTLGPGRYAVRAIEPRCEPIEIDVLDSMVEVTLAPDR